MKLLSFIINVKFGWQIDWAHTTFGRVMFRVAILGVTFCFYVKHSFSCHAGAIIEWDPLKPPFHRGPQTTSPSWHETCLSINLNRRTTESIYMRFEKGVSFLMRSLILADDLTGACDTAAQFGSRGLSVQIAVSDSSVAPFTSGVLAVNTATRHADAETLQSERSRLAGQLAPMEDALIYQKIDSSLRGMIPQEIEATLSAFGRSRAVIAPAFPALGRTTVGGFQLVHHDLVSRTSAGNDILAPSREASIPALLRREASPSTIGSIDMSFVHQGVSAVKERLKQLCEADVQYIVCDALIQEDLDVVAAAVWEMNPQVLWVGSAGLARSLTKAASLPGSPLLQLPTPFSRPLIVSGSMHSVTRRQVRQFLARLPSVKITIESERASDDGRYTHAIMKAWREGVYPVLSTDEIQVGPAETMRQRLSDIVGSLQPTPTHLVLTGGDVAEAVLRRLGLDRLTVQGEILDGIPIMHAPHGMEETVVVTKSGAFGEEETLLRIHEWMAGTTKREVCKG